MGDKVAIYCRLSEEDKNKRSKNDDSGSIQNQKLMLSEYAKQKGWDIYHIYSDDDYTGSDRNRPAFNQMITDAQLKKFNIILCKTQSRFTRELEIVEKYIHGLFPELGIRFVSIVDNIDTNIAGNKKSRQINGLVNEWYLEDMSESIKAALKTRMKAGYFIGSFAPYGYQKDENHKGHLVIDEEAAAVVRQIFDLYNSGIGRTGIARILNEKGIPSPEEYSRLKKTKKNTVGKKNSKFWKYYTVSHILENEVYIGTLVQGKTHNPTYKSKHSVPTKRENWVRIENAHEPIIDMETWKMTRNLWNKRSKPAYRGEINKYTGVLVCGKCGYHMGTAYNKQKRFYRCNHAKYGKNCCSGTSVFESTLDRSLLQEIAKLSACYLDRQELTEEAKLLDDYRSGIERIQKQIRQFEKQTVELERAMKQLYLDKLKGIVSDRQFLELSKGFEEEKDCYISNIDSLKKELDEERSAAISEQQKKQMIREIVSFTEITRSFVTLFIDRIEISGTKNHRIINIYWKF